MVGKNRSALVDPKKKKKKETKRHSNNLIILQTHQLVVERTFQRWEANRIEPADLPSLSLSLFPSNQSSSISRWKTLERPDGAQSPVSLVPLNPSQPPHIPRWIKRSSSGSVPPVKRV